MNGKFLEFTQVGANERVPFHCTGCGACCQNVKQSVPVETLDAFRIVKFLREQGQNISCMDDFWERYTEPALLDTCGYFVYFLRVQGQDDTCVFLKNRRCIIHAVNPRACRTYPFTVDPESGRPLLAKDRPHHFNGDPVKAKNWMKQRMTQEDWAYLKLDYGTVVQIAQLLRRVPESAKEKAIMLFQYYKYSAYDLDKPFLEQFQCNQARLLRELSKLTQL